MAYDRKFDGVITNPPFGSLSEPMLFGKFKIKRLEHAMALNALRCMKDDGKAAIIIGGHTTWDEHGRVTAGTNRIFLNYLYHFYNVEDIIPINGKKLYSRQGTSINTRLILINGAKEKPEGAAPLKNKLHSTVVNSHEELWERVGLGDERKAVPKGNLYVYYGFRKLTPKAVKKPQLVVFFENANNNPSKNREWVERRMEIVHERVQSADEKTDSPFSNRMFTEYGYLINEKPYYGDIEKVLDANYEADKNHVSVTERETIRKKLREAYYRVYKVGSAPKKPADKDVKIIKLRAKAILIKQKQLSLGNLPISDSPLRILVACEESQVVTMALRSWGHEAHSCDILPTTGKHPEWHIQDDVLNQLGKGWDMMIAFPPCTYLTVSGNAWMQRPRTPKTAQKGNCFYPQTDESTH
jgi:hypothetical protein